MCRVQKKLPQASKNKASKYSQFIVVVIVESLPEFRSVTPIFHIGDEYCCGHY